MHNRAIRRLAVLLFFCCESLSLQSNGYASKITPGVRTVAGALSSLENGSKVQGHEREATSKEAWKEPSSPKTANNEERKRINENLSADIFEVVKVVVPQFSFNRRRFRREINSFNYYEEEDQVSVAHLDDITLELRANENLITPRTSTWIYGNFSHEKNIPKCNFTRGKVIGYPTTSLAAITLCESEMVGLIHASNKTLFIVPLRDSENSHVIYKMKSSDDVKSRNMRQKRSSLDNASLTWEFFNLTGDTIDLEDGNGGMNSERLHLEENIDILDNFDAHNHQQDESKVFTVEMENNRLWGDQQDEDLGYFFDSAWDINVYKQRVNASHGLPHRWLEIALAVDHTVISFHGKERVEHYILSLMNIVSAIYQDPSLEANLQLIISRLLFYDNKKQGVVRPGNAKKSLENVNAWNRRLHLTLAPGEASHDVAVWLTRADIGGPSGYAPVGGACDPKRSCALNKDEGLSSAFIIAHEMGHLLGLTHDGDTKQNNNCGDEALDGSVMAPMVAATFHKFSWSQCSRDEFKTKVSKYYCLKNPPLGLGETVLNTTVHATFSMDEQCRMEFGEGFELCRAFEIIEPCSHLWCSHKNTPLVCKTKKGPPLEGTECGENKWCVDGYCQDVDVRKFGMEPVVHNPQDGRWSDWSEWGLCSRTCGTGVQFRTRKCDNPPPSYGGSDCFGSSEEWKLCNTEKCPEPITDIRAQQCKRLPKILDLRDQRSNVTWLPYESDEERLKCQLICLGKESRELFVTGENLLDGTPCSYDNGSDICIQGTCQPLGCDGKLFSELKEDNCGVCGGTNTDCKEVEKYHQKRIKRELNRIAVIPRLSRQIQVQANLTTHSALNSSVTFILKDRLKRIYSIPIPNGHVQKEIVEGTRFLYRRNNGIHRLEARGPILAEIIVLLYVPKTEVEIGVNASYIARFFLNKTLLETTGRFGWVLGGWGPCSASCGGGRRQRTIACWDRLHNRIVRKKYCSLAFKPVQPVEKCNTFSCSFQWLSGQWEPCSATCGSRGVQYRELYCIPRSIWTEASEKRNETILQNPWRFMVSPAKCAGQKPQSSRPCYRIPCLSFWEYEEWSPCSASCGPGLSSRYARCPPPSEDETFYTCGASPGVQNRVCLGALTKSKHPSCRKKKKCNGDQSKYCSMKHFQHYCQLGGFRRVCCEACKHYRKLAPVSS